MRVEIEVANDVIEGALYGAFDSGGILYWGYAADHASPTDTFWCLAPLHDGWIRVQLSEPDTRYTPQRLDAFALRRGLQLMAERSPKLFGQLVCGDYDANLGDVLVQYAVFGEVVFG